MAQIEVYEEIFRSGNDSYTAQRLDTIARHRRELGGTLFFDRLLKTMCIEKASNIYPPKSATDLKKLHSQINDCKSVLHHKQSVIYYLLLDLADSHDKDSAGQYAHDTAVPKKYITLMRGLWHLDQVDFKHALDCLTAPNLIPSFVEDTLTVLCDHPKSKPSYVLAYFHTVAPALENTEVLNKVFRCICLSSVTEAFFFARRQGGSAHRHLFNEMIIDVLQSKGGEAKAKMTEELVNLSFDTTEEKWFEEYLTQGDGRSLAESKHLLIMRLIMKGGSAKASRIAANLNEKPIEGLSWKSLLQVG